MNKTAENVLSVLTERVRMCENNATTDEYWQARLHEARAALCSVQYAMGVLMVENCYDRRAPRVLSDKEQAILDRETHNAQFYDDRRVPMKDKLTQECRELWSLRGEA